MSIMESHVRHAWGILFIDYARRLELLNDLLVFGLKLYYVCCDGKYE